MQDAVLLVVDAVELDAVRLAIVFQEFDHGADLWIGYAKHAQVAPCGRDVVVRESEDL